MLLGDSKLLTVDDFPMVGDAQARLTEAVPLPSSGIDIEQLERSLVVQALERSGWNQTRAAALLGLNRDQIRYRIEKFKLKARSESLVASAVDFESLPSTRHA